MKIVFLISHKFVKCESKGKFFQRRWQRRPYKNKAKIKNDEFLVSQKI